MRTFLGLNSQEPYPSSLKRKFRRRLLTSSRKIGIRNFHVVVVQWRQKDVQKSWCTCRHVVLPIKPIAFLRSRCRRRRRILKSLLTREVQSRGARGVMGRRNEGRHSFFYSFPSPLVLRSVKLLVFHPPRAIQIETTGNQSGIEQQARSGHSSFLSPVPS